MCRTAEEFRMPLRQPVRPNDRRDMGNAKRQGAMRRGWWSCPAPVPGIPARAMDRCSTAGLLAHGYPPSICLPAPQGHSGMAPSGATRMDGNPLTVAGAATALAPFGRPHRVPFSSPPSHRRGTVAPSYAERGDRVKPRESGAVNDGARSLRRRRCDARRGLTGSRRTGSPGPYRPRWTSWNPSFDM